MPLALGRLFLWRWTAISIFFAFAGVQMDLWALRKICGRSCGFTGVQENLQSLSEICGRSAQITQKKHGRRTLPRAAKSLSFYLFVNIFQQAELLTQRASITTYGIITKSRLIVRSFST
ncbi:hypothetical protein QOZ98_001277 [Planomicrobium stackebrandtii]|uniref:Secreted protein n=1 Tax=Planomicrobium stackebrandtii TaxID=253160 RepID=A0ABU0GUI8_9BACL|nr:hypothetical protein [Planomicrobium stackebrandtii]MDQ0428451.1 hypothetical protein [Planomicrobium stackebrandtii]